MPVAAAKKHGSRLAERLQSFHARDSGGKYLLRPGPRHNRGRQFVLERCRPVELQRAGRGSGAADDQSTAIRPKVPIDGGKTVRIQPQDWRADKIAGAPIVMDELDQPFAKKGKRTVL